MADNKLEAVRVTPIGFVQRMARNENEKDRSLACKIVLRDEYSPGLDGIEEWSHIYIVCWLDKVAHGEEPVLHLSGPGDGSSAPGIFATRAPIHPNPIGLTLVELVSRDGNVLLVRGLDVYEGTPVLDIKPYPDWERGCLLVVTDFRVPGWLTASAGKAYTQSERIPNGQINWHGLL